MRIPHTVATAVFVIVLVAEVEGFGFTATMAVVDSSGTVCGILASARPRSIQCVLVGKQAFPCVRKLLL
ncbi:hypothetical protein IEQ34_005532 [Dendrobium chrysotoxum]|uniref:Secreted protein n=1 Tax=Dendrobium chrysotoxum TaxID=161865 RepID=A0AAV7HBE8_DENCH|nr:hypothetical protein IEQ34_005532 [Dendrobium chrysotoxum]